MKCSSLDILSAEMDFVSVKNQAQLQSFHLLERTLFRLGKKKSDFSVVERLQLHTDVRNAEKS